MKRLIIVLLVYLLIIGIMAGLGSLPAFVCGQRGGRIDADTRIPSGCYTVEGTLDPGVLKNNTTIKLRICPEYKTH